MSEEVKATGSALPIVPGITIPTTAAGLGFAGGMVYADTASAGKLIDGLLALLARMTPVEAMAGLFVGAMMAGCWFRSEHFRQDLGKVLTALGLLAADLKVLLDRRRRNENVETDRRGSNA